MSVGTPEQQAASAAQFAQAIEVSLEQTMAALKAIGERMDQYEAVTLWRAKQQWPLDDQAATWEQLVTLAKATKREPARLHTPPPVRDLL